MCPVQGGSLFFPHLRRNKARHLSVPGLVGPQGALPRGGYLPGAPGAPGGPGTIWLSLIAPPSVVAAGLAGVSWEDSSWEGASSAASSAGASDSMDSADSGASASEVSSVGSACWTCSASAGRSASAGSLAGAAGAAAAGALGAPGAPGVIAPSLMGPPFLGASATGCSD